MDFGSNGELTLLDVETRNAPGPVLVAESGLLAEIRHTLLEVLNITFHVVLPGLNVELGFVGDPDRRHSVVEAIPGEEFGVIEVSFADRKR